MATPTMSPIAEAIALQDGAIQRGEYTILGQLMLLQTERGDMEFFRNGPLVGTMNDRLQLVFASPWRGLPDKQEVQNLQCPTCRVECEQCSGTGRSACQICGGSGEVRHAANCACVSPERNALRPDADCAHCGGSGVVRMPLACGNCAMEGLADCTACHGQGWRGCGRTEDAPCEACQTMGRPRAAGSSKCKCAECPDCHGYGRVVLTMPQPLDQFAHGKLEGMVAFGPIRQVVWHTVDGSGHIQICDIRPDRDGNLMVMLLRGQKGDQPHAYFLGGLPVLRKRS